MSRTQLNIRLSDAQKERWREAAETSTEYNNITHLIRRAVENELSDATAGSKGGGPSLDEEHADTLREIKASSERTEDGITDLKARLRQLEERVGESGETFSLRAAVRETLPEAVYEESGGGSTRVNPKEYALTAKQVAARLNADESEVEDALDALETESSEVHSGGPGPDGEILYFYEGGGV